VAVFSGWVLHIKRSGFTNRERFIADDAMFFFVVEIERISCHGTLSKG
jgi:hypothetical protein